MTDDVELLQRRAASGLCTTPKRGNLLNLVLIQLDGNGAPDPFPFPYKEPADGKAERADRLREQLCEMAASLRTRNADARSSDTQPVD